ncbi:MAG: ATP-dependent DNA ligase, partial [Methanobacteriota archaeon]
MGPVGHLGRLLLLPERDPQRSSGRRRGPDGRVPRGLLPLSRANGDAGRRRNVETRSLGWSGFAVTPTTPEETPFARLADLTTKLEATTKRLEKRALLAAFLRSLRREEVAPAVHLIVGRIFAESDSRALNVGWATLKKALAGTKQATLVPRPLTILEVTHMFGQIAEARGADSTRARRRLLESLLGRASEGERDVLLRNVFGEMRIGVNEGVMLEGIADAAGVEADSVRTAHMFLGDLGLVAEIALFEGAAGLRSRGLRLLAPMKPMLAEMAEDLDEVLREHGGQTAIEYKLDGARIQIHRKDSLPEIVAIAKSLPASEFLLEGEVVAVDADGKPLPFQDLMRRFRRVHGIEAAQEEIPLKLYLFDLLHLDGRTLIDEPYRERWRLLEGLVPSEFLTARRIVKRKEEIEPFLQAALTAGHEGLMAKALDSTYSVGKRGKKWFKIKPADRLDMAIVAAEWGSGRREGWLSNYWLAVREEATDAFQMIGKTFKGLTDAEFETMTERLRGLATSEERWGFHVRPEVVVEVAYNEIQRSPRYPSGFALRFARITRIRDDKGPEDVDTYARLKELYAKQFERKGR